MLFAGTLLKNGSFEEGLAEWSARWGSPVSSQESSVHGSRSLLLEGERACVLQSIELEEGVTYEVSGYVKGEGSPSGDGNGARLVLEGNNRWLRVTSHLDETPDAGTFDWRFMRGLFTAERTNGTTVGIAPTLVGGGKAWSLEDEGFLEWEGDSLELLPPQLSAPCVMQHEGDIACPGSLEGEVHVHCVPGGEEATDSQGVVLCPLPWV